jgi:hypothetical protein
MNMNATAMLLFLLSGISLAEGKDPLTRDEDISGTGVSVRYAMRADGLWEYTYTLVSPPENLGTIGSFAVDLTCDKAFSGYTLPAPQASKYYHAPLAADGYSPVTVMSEGKQALGYGISIDRRAMWAVFLHPGHSRTSLTLVSPAGPGWRSWSITPVMETEGWAYTDPPAPGTPWIDEFTVFGTVAGPGCPGVTPPVETPSFDGSAWRNEAEATNRLLTYKAPMVDKWHEGAEVASFQMEIAYAADIDPNTFKVTPGWLRSQFDPKPGARQTITIPLKPGKNMISLEVGSSAAPSKRGSYHVTETWVDRDVFEIRQDAPAKGRSAQ